VVSESRVTWATSVPILVFLGLSVLELGPMYATGRQTSDVRQTWDWTELNVYWHTCSKNSWTAEYEIIKKTTIKTDSINQYNRVLETIKLWGRRHNKPIQTFVYIIRNSTWSIYNIRMQSINWLELTLTITNTYKVYAKIYDSLVTIEPQM